MLVDGVKKGVRTSLHNGQNPESKRYCLNEGGFKVVAHHDLKYDSIFVNLVSIMHFNVSKL